MYVLVIKLIKYNRTHQCFDDRNIISYLRNAINPILKSYMYESVNDANK